MLINVKPDGTVSERAVTEIMLALALHAGHVADLAIKRWFPKRSNQQNRTVRGFWLPIILKEQGYFPHDADFVYNSIKMEIGWTEERVNEKSGLVTKVPRPTAGCNTAEYAEFMTRFKAYSEDRDTGLGIILPDPDSSKAHI